MANTNGYILILYISCIKFVCTRAALDCEVAKNISFKCLTAEVDMLRSKSRAIDGSTKCDKPVSEQACELCRSFNTSKGCLDIMLDSCDYSDIHEFIWSTKLSYVGTIASLCNFNNLVTEIHENKDCYTGITVNLRQCYKVLEYKPSCRAAIKGYRCSTQMADAYCGSLYNKAGNHRQLSLLYLRVLEPMIDTQNCTDESELFIAQIYPEFQYRWRKSTPITLEYKPTPVKYTTNSSGLSVIHTQSIILFLSIYSLLYIT